MVDLSIVVCNVYYRPGRIYPDVGGISWYPQDHATHGMHGMVTMARGIKATMECSHGLLGIHGDSN